MLFLQVQHRQNQTLKQPNQSVDPRNEGREGARNTGSDLTDSTALWENCVLKMTKFNLACL